jgi:hypothetical protein
MQHIIDPLVSNIEREDIRYVPRPRTLHGLRIGLIENTTRNAETVLRMVAERLAAVHGMKTEVVVHKYQRAALKDDQIAELKGKVDFAIVGVGA